MVIMIHIDYLILAYKKTNITTKYIKLLDSLYRTKDLLTVIRGRFTSILE